LLSRRWLTSQTKARMACFRYNEGWYDPARLLSGLEHLSPMAFEPKREAALTKP